jgi:thiol-disulfide isomerase/thioredoxin
MKNSLIDKLLIALVFLLGGLINTNAQVKEDKPADPAELAKIRASIEANPGDLSAHEAYLKASGFAKWNAPDDPAFIKQYEDWMKKFPKSAAIPYALGHAYASKESPKAKPYLLKAVEIDPKYDKAYFDLWIDGERWGDSKLSSSYLLKAKEADPKNADYAFYYANGFDDIDFDKYTKLSLQVAKDFPQTERGAQALYWLANKTPDPKLKVQYYEQQKRDFPPDKFNWTSSGMSEYYNLLLTSDPEKAVALAQSMADLTSSDREQKMWQTNISNARNIIEANSLLAQGKATEASVIMEKITVPRYGSSKDYILFLKCKTMDAAGRTADAYKNLLLAYVKEPTAQANEQLLAYGSKIGKDAATVAGDVWYIRDTSSKQAPNFTLENYYTKKKTSLSDYKGKVVLITYWFPGCGPCRGEFPHFENVVKKFKDRSDFVYLGINISPEQDDYVLPFMKGSGYSFIPLKDNDQWQKGPLDNRNAAPMNFLIDGNGRIIYSNFRTDASNESTLETMISSMLERKKGA